MLNVFSKDKALAIAAEPTVAETAEKVARAQTDRDRAMANREKAAATLAQAEAAHANLASLDDAALTASFGAIGLARQRLDTAEKLTRLADAALADAESKAERAARVEAYMEVLAVRNFMAKRWGEEWPVHAPPLFDLVRDAAVADDLCMQVNKALPEGFVRLAPIFGLASAQGAAFVAVSVTTISGKVIRAYAKDAGPADPKGFDGFA